MGIQKIARFLLAVTALLAWQTHAWATVGAADIAVAIKSLGFMNGVNPGTLDIQVLYDPGNSSSRADAETAAEALANAKSTKFTLKPTLTPISAISSTKLAYVSRGLEAHFGAIRSTSAARDILTFTNDHSCLEARACALYVSANPNVVIETSQSVLAATHYTPAAALKMMIKEAP